MSLYKLNLILIHASIQTNGAKKFHYILGKLIYKMEQVTIATGFSNLSFTVMLNLGRHSLDQLRIILMNLDLKAIATGHQVNWPAVLKPP